MGYKFKPLELRAQCLENHDGDTALLFIDRGDRDYCARQVRFLGRDGVGFDAYELNDKDATKAQKAQEAKDLVRDWLDPMDIKNVVRIDDWPLRIVTHKEDADDSFGRWLAEVYFTDKKDGVEKNVAEELLKRGLGIPWKKKKNANKEPTPG